MSIDPIDLKILYDKYGVTSLKELDNYITSILDDHKRQSNMIKRQTMALCDFNNRETAIEKWGDKRPEFNLDKYYEVCMEEVKQIVLKSTLQRILKEKINECEQGIWDIIYGEKDSYIVKHDIAIKKIKEIADELEVNIL